MIKFEENRLKAHENCITKKKLRTENSATKNKKNALRIEGTALPPLLRGLSFKHCLRKYINITCLRIFFLEILF